MGWMAAAKPTTASVLNRLEPRTLPMARSFSFLRAAAMQEASSGSEVPTATTVRPMTRSLTPSDWAMETAPHTSARELAMSNSRPAASQNSATPSFMGWSFSSASTSSPSASLPSFSPCQMLQPMTLAKATSRMTASMRLSWPSTFRATASSVTAASSGSSFLRMRDCTTMGLTMAVRPRMSAMLAMLEPYALPSAMPGLPSMAEMAETAISGAEVPKPMMTTPMSKGGREKCTAAAAAPSTNLSALQTRTARPKPTASRGNHTVMTS